MTVPKKYLCVEVRFLLYFQQRLHTISISLSFRNINHLGIKAQEPPADKSFHSLFMVTLKTFLELVLVTAIVHNDILATSCLDKHPSKYIVQSREYVPNSSTLLVFVLSNTRRNQFLHSILSNRAKPISPSTSSTLQDLSKECDGERMER